MQETSNIIEDTFSAYKNKNTSNEGLVFEAREVFVNGFWQLDSKPPNHMSDKAISMIDKYLKGLCVGRSA